MEVISKTAHAEIFVDGIQVGEGHANIEIPCGEKQLTVEKEGYLPYRAYLPLTKEQPLKVTVDLEKSKKKSDYALSSLLVEQVKKGEALVSPHATEEEKAAAIKFAELRKGAEAAMYQAKGAGDSAAPGAGATRQQSWDSVEDWR